MHDFTTSSISHLENTGSLSYIDHASADIFYVSYQVTDISINLINGEYKFS